MFYYLKINKLKKKRLKKNKKKKKKKKNIKIRLLTWINIIDFTIFYSIIWIRSIII